MEDNQGGHKFYVDYRGVKCMTRRGPGRGWMEGPGDRRESPSRESVKFRNVVSVSWH